MSAARAVAERALHDDVERVEQRLAAARLAVDGEREELARVVDRHAAVEDRA